MLVESVLMHVLVNDKVKESMSCGAVWTLSDGDRDRREPCRDGAGKESGGKERGREGEWRERGREAEWRDGGMKG